jgi:hypothetical protein
MKKVKILAVITCVMVVANVALADSDWVAWSHPDGTIHQYKRIDTLMTWNNAETYAESLGGYLATVTSAEENNFIFDKLNTDGVLYAALGGFQPPDTAEPDVGWQWVTGEPWSYTNWGATQPDDAWGGQDYLTFWGNNGIYGVWDDDYIDRKPYPSIVETPEPTTLFLLGFGGLALLRKHRA